MAGKWWSAGLDTSELKRDKDKAKQMLGDLNQSAVKEGKMLDDVYRKIGTTIAGVFTVAAAKRFLSDVVRIRGEFQQLEIAFGTMLRSEEKAVKLMGDLSKFAAETPFGLQSSANAAKQLIAYGSQADTVISEMRMLGDVSAGTGQSINDIVYLYGTLRVQGRAYLMDVRQFAARGIPIYDELAKVLKTSKDKVNDFVSAGKVGFKEIEQAFKNMTAEGSMYGGLMEAQSKSVTGRIEQLTDAIDLMFNNIGKSSEGVIYKAIDTASSLVENYEQVGKVIAELVVVYGSYRAALIVSNSLNQIYIASKAGMTAAEMGHYAALTLAQKAQLLLNKTILANPYALAAAGVVALGYGIYKLATYQTDAEKAQKRYNEAVEESIKGNVEEEASLARLKGRLEATTKGTDEWKKAKDEIVSKFGKYKSNLDEEIEKTGTLKTSYEELTKAIQASFDTRLYGKFREEQTAELDNVLSENLGKIQDALLKRLGDEKGAGVYEQVRSALIKGEEISTDLQSVLDKAQNKGTLIARSHIDQYINNIQDAQKATDDFDKKAKQRFNITDTIDPESKGGTKTPLSNLSNEIKAATKDLADLKKKLSDLRSGKAESYDYAGDIESAAKAVKEAEEKLANLTGVSKSGGTKVSGGAKESEYSKEILDQEKKLAEEQLDLQKRKTDGKLALIEIEKNAAINAINEEEEAAKKLAESEGKSFDSSVFDSRRSVATESFDKQTEDILKDMLDKQAEMYRQLDEVFLSSEEKKREAIKRTYREMRDEAKKSLDSGDMTDETYKITIAKIDAAELEAQKQRLLEAVEDLNTKQVDINKRYDSLILDAQKQLNEAKTEEEKEAAERLISLLEESREKALSTIQSQMLQETDEWRNLFVNLEYLTAEQIEKIVEKIEQGLGNMNLDPADLKAITDQLERAKDVAKDLRNRNPFVGIINSAERYKNALKKLKKAQDDLNEATKNGADDKTLNKLSVAVGKAKKGVEEAASAMVDNLNDVKSIVDAIGGSLMSVFDSFGMMQDDSSKQMADSIMGIAGGALQAGTGIAKMASGDIVGGVIDLAKGLGDVIVGINGVSDASKQKTIEQLYKTIEHTEKEIKSLTKAYEDLERASSKAFSTARAEMIAEQAALNQQEIELLKKQNETYLKMIEEEKSKKGSDDSVIKGFEDAIEANLDRIKDLTNAIEDSQDAFIEAMIGTSVMSAINQFAQAYADAFTSGNDAAKASADIIKNLLKNALIEAMKNDLAEDIKDYTTMLAEAMMDGYISASEQAALDALKKKLDEAAEKWQSQFEVEEDKRGGVTGELKKEMTEGTASQLVGLWNMTAMDIRSIKEILFDKMGGDSRLLLEANKEGASELLRIMDYIGINTFRTAENTNDLIPTLKELKTELEEIRRNTKEGGSRG